VTAIAGKRYCDCRQHHGMRPGAPGLGSVRGGAAGLRPPYAGQGPARPPPDPPQPPPPRACVAPRATRTGPPAAAADGNSAVCGPWSRSTVACLTALRSPEKVAVSGPSPATAPNPPTASPPGRSVRPPITLRSVALAISAVGKASVANATEQGYPRASRSAPRCTCRAADRRSRTTTGLILPLRLPPAARPVQGGGLRSAAASCRRMLPPPGATLRGPSPRLRLGSGPLRGAGRPPWRPVDSEPPRAVPCPIAGPPPPPRPPENGSDTGRRGGCGGLPAGR